MNWKSQSRGFFPKLKPSRPSGFTFTEDGKGVLIAGFDQSVVMIVQGRDLHKLQGMICSALIRSSKISSK